MINRSLEKYPPVGLEPAPSGPSSSHIGSHPVVVAICLAITTNRRGSMPSISQERQLVCGTPHALAASLMFQPILWRTIAKRAANVVSEGTHGPA